MNEYIAKDERDKTCFQALKFLTLSFVFALCVFRFTFPCYALDLDKLKCHYLSQDYKSAILEGEKALAAGSRSLGLDELYYILGLSYMKDGNLLRSSDIFEIVLSEFSDSVFKEEARLALGDTYFLRGDFNKAMVYYRDLVEKNPNTKLKAEVYYRFSQLGIKTGDTQLAKDYSDKLKQEFPASINMFDRDQSVLLATSGEFCYSVQVGAFSSITNAQNLTQKLMRKDYPAYIEEATSGGKVSYRVRVGKLLKRQEIVELENKLSKEGYPTKIYP